eukprot:gene42552-52772_t
MFGSCGADCVSVDEQNEGLLGGSNFGGEEGDERVSLAAVCAQLLPNSRNMLSELGYSSQNNSANHGDSNNNMSQSGEFNDLDTPREIGSNSGYGRHSAFSSPPHFPQDTNLHNHSTNYHHHMSHNIRNHSPSLPLPPHTDHEASSYELPYAFQSSPESTVMSRKSLDSELTASGGVGVGQHNVQRPQAVRVSTSAPEPTPI